MLLRPAVQLRNGVDAVDPVSLIVGALAAGAAARGQGSAATAVDGADQDLKNLVGARFVERRSAKVALVEHATDPLTWETQLAKAVTDAGAAQDPEILAVAERLQRLLDDDTGGGVGSPQVGTSPCTKAPAPWGVG
jgi:hypothetical protein